ncbi:hypothetical protein PMI10_03540 [Flavobacterium sp. CF136]|nr:hypothetical protein PMI10_03540 [Flavobacterium sp. CF136]
MLNNFNIFNAFYKHFCSLKKLTLKSFNMKLKPTLSAFLVAFTLMLVSFPREDPASVQNNRDVAIPKNEDISLLAGDCTNVSGWASQNEGTTGGGSNAKTTVTTYDLYSIKMLPSLSI